MTTNTILVVDDEAPILELLTDALEIEGYHVLRSYNGAQALEIAREQVPSLVISDIMMPLMNGLELCRRLKADSRTARVPVVLMTAAALDQARTSNADAVLAKPFELNALLQLVAKHALPPPAHDSA